MPRPHIDLLGHAVEEQKSAVQVRRHGGRMSLQTTATASHAPSQGLFLSSPSNPRPQHPLVFGSRGLTWGIPPPGGGGGLLEPGGGGEMELDSGAPGALTYSPCPPPHGPTLWGRVPDRSGCPELHWGPPLTPIISRPTSALRAPGNPVSSPLYIWEKGTQRPPAPPPPSTSRRTPLPTPFPPDVGGRP